MARSKFKNYTETVAAFLRGLSQGAMTEMRSLDGYSTVVRMSFANGVLKSYDHWPMAALVYIGRRKVVLMRSERYVTDTYVNSRGKTVNKYSRVTERQKMELRGGCRAAAITCIEISGLSNDNWLYLPSTDGRIHADKIMAQARYTLAKVIRATTMIPSPSAEILARLDSSDENPKWADLVRNLALEHNTLAEPLGKKLISIKPALERRIFIAQTAYRLTEQHA
jgi:hypothetical protein